MQFFAKQRTLTFVSSNGSLVRKHLSSYSNILDATRIQVRAVIQRVQVLKFEQDIEAQEILKTKTELKKLCMNFNTINAKINKKKSLF